jgi:hypothetical protein
VFVGSFTLEAAEVVCTTPEGAAPLGVDLLDGLGQLMDHSLVQQREEGDELRFGMLQVIREYALEWLEASAEGEGGAVSAEPEAEALRRAHAAYFLGLVEGRELAMFGPEAGPWLGRLEREHDNFRAALAWARERGEVELGLRLAAALTMFWYMRGSFTEGHGWVEGLLALAQAPRAAGVGAGDSARARDRAEDDGGAGAPGGEGTPRASGVSAAARATALVAASNFAWVQGDDARALAAVEEGLALAQAVGQPAGLAADIALYTLGQLAWDRGDLERATAYMEESAAQLRAVGELGFAAVCLAVVGLIVLDQGDLERATAYLQESLTLARREGAAFAAGAALAGLADVARRRGDLVGAEALGREDLLLRQRLGMPGYLAKGLDNLALTAAAAEQGARAERAARLLGAAAALRERVGAAGALHERVGAPQGLRRRGEIERAATTARSALGEERWAAAYAAGRALTLEEALAEALGADRGADRGEDEAGAPP